MSENPLQDLKDAFKAAGIEAPLPIDEIESLCRAIAAEEPMSVLTTDKLVSILQQIRNPVVEILRREHGLFCLLFLFRDLGERWHYILAELLAEDQNNIQKTVDILRCGVRADMAMALFFVCIELKRRNREIFVEEFIASLSKSWTKSGLTLALSLFDSEDTGLISPLTQYLKEIEQTSCSGPDKKERDEFAKIIKDALTKLTQAGKKRKFWQF